MGGSQSTPTTSPSSSTSRPEVYSVLTPTAAILDFNPNAGTPEYAALSNLLSDDLRHNVTVLNGPGGVGKTTILQALAAQPRIHARFHNAVWMFQLGQQAKLAQLKHEFIAFVSQVCDSQFANRFQDNILDDKLDKRAVADLVRHLADRHILLIFDDVWRMSGSVLELFQRVVTEVQSLETCSFKLLVSTRSEHIANEGCPIHVQLRSPHGPMSERMLLWYAGFEGDVQSDMCTTDRRAFNSILQKCSGLPLALAVAGRGVKRLHNRPTSPQSRVSAWVWYAEQLDEHVEMLGAECPHHPGLLSSLRLNLQGMGENWNVCSITPEEVFRSLSVLQKQMVIPVHCLQRLWAISPKDVKRVVDIFHDSSLVSIDQSETSEDGKRDGIRIHDLMNDISAHMADESDEKTRWHERLLDGYAHDLSRTDLDPDLDPNPNPDPDPDPGSFKTAQTRPWWRLKETEKYMQNNVVRHLLSAERTGEAFHLLMDYRWMQKINEDEKCIPFQPIIADVRLLMKKIEEVGDTDAQGTVDDLRIMVETMEMCMLPYCKKNRRESTFQLYGRLVSLCSESAVVKHVLWSIDKYAKKPWVRANVGVLESATSSYFKRTLSLDFSAVCMEIGPGDDEVLVGSDTGMLYVLNSRDGSEICVLRGHETSIVGIVVERESNDVLSCSSDGTVIVWRDRQKLNTVKIEELEEEETIASMQLRSQCVEDGIILCSSLGRLLLVDMSCGSVERVIGSENEWVVPSATGHTDGMLVSASVDGKFWLWDKTTLQRRENAVERRMGSVHAIAMSADNRLIASASRDGNVCVRNLFEGSAKGYSQCSITCFRKTPIILFSADGKMLYIATPSGILVWTSDESGNFKRSAYKISDRRLEHIRSLRLNEDGSELFVMSSSEVYVLNSAQYVDHRKDIVLDEPNFLQLTTAFSMSDDLSSMVTYNEPDRIIEVRDMHDLSNDVDSCNGSFRIPRNLRRIDVLAVSNDKQFVAFSQFHSYDVIVVDMQSSKLHHILSDLHIWFDSRLHRPASKRAVQEIQFEKNNILTARARASISSNDKMVSKSWNILTGETLERHLPSSRDAPADQKQQNVTRLSCEKISNEQSSQNVKLTEGLHTFTAATLETGRIRAVYASNISRLWILSRDGGLQYVDLVTEGRDLEQCNQPALPLLPSNKQAHDKAKDSSIRADIPPEFTVFISHAGPDKHTLALKIYNRLKKLGISVFFDLKELKPGDEADEKMINAMETAAMFIIILSPEYAARKWTIMELQCALRRIDEAKKNGQMAPIIIPVFFRLNIDDCSSSKLLGMTDERGDNIFHRDGLFERLMDGHATVDDVSRCLKRLTHITGIKNCEENAISDKAPLDDLADMVVEAIRNRVAKEMLQP